MALDAMMVMAAASVWMEAEGIAQRPPMALASLSSQQGPILAVAKQRWKRKSAFPEKSQVLPSAAGFFNGVWNNND
jgi:hypothetical protein